MCLALEVSRSGYYAWLGRGESKRALSNKELLKEIERVYRESRRTYGYLRITRKLNREGIFCSKNRVARLMRKNGIVAKTKRRFKATTDSKHDFPIATNLLKQNFYTREPNKIWVADITYIPTGEGWLYLAALADLFNREIVGWAMDKTMTRELVLKALKQAIGRKRPPGGLIHHSDQGKQYASFDYQQALKDNGIRSSMSRKGNCYDNACMESFFGTLKQELIYGNRFDTRAEACSSIFEYIEVFYNRNRLHSALEYMSPVEYELCFQRAS